MALILISSETVTSDGSSEFTLDNQRNVDMVVFDIENARSERLSSSEHAINSSLVYEDIDGDGYPEIFYCSAEGALIQYSTKDDSYQVLLAGGSSRYRRAPQIVDLDLDGRFEGLIYDFGSGAFRCFDLTSREEEWSVQGVSQEPVLDWDLDPYAKVLMEPETGGSRIFLAMSPGRLLMVNETGKELWRYDVEHANVSRPFLLPMLGVADIDLDGDLDAVAVSPKSSGGKRYVGIDIFSLDPPTWEREWTLPFTHPRRIWVVTPPLLHDIDQTEDGLEIVFATDYGGILAVSSATGDVLWRYEVEDDEKWMSIDTIRTQNGTRVIASSRERIQLLEATTGEERVMHPMGTNRLSDPPQLGYYEPDMFQPGLLFSSGWAIRALASETRRTIWHESYDEKPSSMRHLLVTSREGVAVELHVFFWVDQGKENMHLRYWIPQSEDREITVDPDHWAIHPNMSLDVSGINIEGSPDDIQWVLLRLYQGRADDLMAVRTYRVGPQAMRLTYPHFMSMQSANIENGTDNMLVELTLLVPWYFVHFGNVHLHVTAYWTDGTSLSIDIMDWLRWVWGLVASGGIELEDQEGKKYTDGDWISGDKDVKLQGVFLTYPDGHHFPDPGDIVIDLICDGIVVDGTLGPDGEITADLHIPGDMRGEYSIWLEISNKWTEFQVNYSMVVHMDPDPPKFLGFHPENGTWVGTTGIVVGCSLTDGLGSGVSDVLIQYWAEGEAPGTWSVANEGTTGSTDIEVLYDLKLNEGTWHLRWKAYDVVRNGPVIGQNLTLNVDLSTVVYEGFKPTGWVTDSQVQVTVTVRDVGGSGVDLGSIEYAVSTDGLFSFSSWTSAGLNGTREEVTVQLMFELEEGVDNYVLYNVSDMADNTRNSSAYQVKVDASLPYFLVPEPAEYFVVLNRSVITCSISIRDDLSGVDPGTVQYQYSSGPTGWSDWTTASNPEGGERHIGEIRRNLEGSTVVRWRARDRVHEEYSVSQAFVINLNRPPEIIDLRPGTSHRISAGGTVFFGVNVSDPEGDPMAIEWQLDSEALSANSSFEISFEEGVYQIMLLVHDGNGNSLEVPITIVAEAEPESANGYAYLYGLVLAVIVFTIAVIWLMLRGRKDR
jgi:hypothetical protein